MTDQLMLQAQNKQVAALVRIAAALEKIQTYLQQIARKA